MQDGRVFGGGKNGVGFTAVPLNNIGLRRPKSRAAAKWGVSRKKQEVLQRRQGGDLLGHMNDCRKLVKSIQGDEEEGVYEEKRVQ